MVARTGKMDVLSDKISKSVCRGKPEKVYETLIFFFLKGCFYQYKVLTLHHLLEYYFKNLYYV